ncbi:hypothetical protein J3A83DRAFT_4295864 [Scleroderma citrinum]
MDLLDESLRDHVRLQLPLAIFNRYGPLPEAMADAATASSTTCIDIKVDIQMSNIIRAICSPTHPDISLLRYKTHDGRKSQRRMSASLKSPTFFQGDFVITAHADGLDKPRCFAEVAVKEDDTETIAMQLTLVPSFKVPRISSQEYIFVIDKSGSMQGPRINTAKHTLVMLLRLMPSDQTAFNILSFSNNVEPLWELSREFDQISLQQAINHVEALTIDGGTEIAMALSGAINARKGDRPTAIFLLTDGEVYDLDGPPTIVANAVRNSPPHAPLRVFVLGIGDASSEMCEKIARAGNGECLFAISHESILGKCARLLNAGRTKKIERIEVDWNIQSASGEPQAHNAASPSSADGPELEPPPTLQQAPHTLTKIFAGIRFTVFVIISSTRVPPSIKLFTKFEGVDNPMEWVVPVTEVKPFRNSDSTIPLVHTLAARKLITELSEGRALLPGVVGLAVASDDEIRKAAIVRLGLEYQLVSQYTSFVAVEDEQSRSAKSGRSRSERDWIRTRLKVQSSVSSQQTSRKQDTNEEDDGLLGALINGITSAFSFVFSTFSGASSISTSYKRQNIPGMYVDTDSSADDASSRGRGPSTRVREKTSLRRHSIETFSTMSSLEGSCSSCWTSSRSPSPEVHPDDPISRAPSPEFIHQGGTQNTTDPTTAQAPFLPVDASTRPPTVPKEAYELFQLLNLDGSFSPSADLQRIVGDGILDKAEELGVESELWATVVAVAYLKMNLENEPDLLDALLAKAEDFVKKGQTRGRGRSPPQFEDMVRQASEFLRIAQEGNQS